MRFPLKAGDTSPTLQLRLGFPANLTGGAATFSMRGRDATAPTIVSQQAMIGGTQDDPVVSYDWQPGDTDQPGEYLAEFTLTYADGAVETAPRDGYILVVVGERV